MWKKIIDFFKIKSQENKSDLPIKAFRLKENCGAGCFSKKGRIYIQWRGKHNREFTQILATAIDYHSWNGGFGHYLSELKRNRQVEEIPLTELRVLKPHWNKEFNLILDKFNIIL